MRFGDYKTKSVILLLWHRIYGREKIISFILIVSVIIALICEYGSAAWFNDHICSIIRVLSSAHNLFSTISLGFITGILVYLISVVYTEVRRSMPLSFEIEQTFKDIEDCFTSFGLELQLGDIDKREDYIAHFLKGLETRGRESERYYTLKPYQNIIEKLGISLEKKSQHLLSYTSCFTTHELETLMAMRHQLIAKQLTTDLFVEDIKTDKGIKQFAGEIIQLRNAYAQLHQDFCEKRFTNISSTNNHITMKQKTLFIWAGILCFFISMNAFAQTYVTIANLRYQLNGTEAYVSGYTGSPTDVVIPETIESDGLTFKVTQINSGAFSSCSSITSVKADGNNLVTINPNAFHSCSALQEVYLPSVQNVYYRAFDSCTALQEVNLQKVVIIDYEAFYNCSNLVKIHLGTSLKCLSYQCFYNCSKLSYAILPSSCIYYWYTNSSSLSGYSINASNISTTSNSIRKNFDYYSNNVFVGCSRLQAIIYLGSQTSKCRSNATVYNINNLLSWNENNFSYTGSAPTSSYTCSLPFGFQPNEQSLPTLEKNAGTYETTIPVTFANNDMEFTADIPYKYTISPVALTARVKNATKVYGDSNPQFQTEYTGFITGEDESVITNKGTYSTSATASSAVGTYNVTQSGATAQNYTFQYEPGTLTVTKAPLTMTPRDKSMIYGDRVPTLEVDYAGLKNNESKPTWVTEPNITTMATQASNAGTYPITISGGEGKNYDVTFKQGTLTIGKASLTATTKDATREYGEENPDFKMAYSGLKNNDTEPTWAVAPTFATPATKSSPVGTYAVTASGGEARNYYVQYVNNGKLTITKAPLTATARSYTKKQGEPNPVFAVDYTGFKNGETKLALTQEPVATCTAKQSSRPGTYPIMLSDGIAMNYDMTYVNGTLTILPADSPGEDTDNTLSLDNLLANKSTQALLPIAMKNAKSITGFQFDLYLPDGVTVATNSKGKLLVSTTDRMDGNYTVSGSVIDDYVRIIGYSVDSDPFLGNEGDILNITLNVGSDIADGDYTIRIKDIVLSDVNNTEYHPADAAAVLTVKSYTPGDVDNSGAININDVVCIINHILHKTNGTFIEEAADVDENGAININDVVTLINKFILHRNNAPRRAPMAAVADDNYLYLDGIELEPGQVKEVAVMLSNTKEVKAVQGNIKLPEGLTFVTKSNGRLDVKNLNERSEDFTLSCALQEDGSMTFAHYSADGYAYDGNEGGIFTFKIQAAEDAALGDYEVKLSDMVLSINGVGYEEEARTSKLSISNTTGIRAVEGDEWNIGTVATLYDLAGRRIQTENFGRPSQKGIYIINGKKVVVK